MKKSKFNLQNLKGKIRNYIYKVLVDSMYVFSCALWHKTGNKNAEYIQLHCLKSHLLAFL